MRRAILLSLLNGAGFKPQVKANSLLNSPLVSCTLLYVPFCFTQILRNAEMRFFKKPLQVPYDYIYHLTLNIC